MGETSYAPIIGGDVLYVPSVSRQETRAETYDIWSKRDDRRLEAGDYLFKQGEAGRSVFRICGGLIETRAPLDAAYDIAIDFRGEGAVLGVTAVFGHGRHNFSARAATRVTFREISGEDFRRRVFDDRRVFRTSLSDAAASMDRCMALAGQLKLKSATQRLASFLLELVAVAENADDVRLPMTKVQLASYLGMAPESLSRCLKQLRDLSVTVTGDRVHIADPAIVRTFVEKV